MLSGRLPTRIETSAVKRIVYATEIVQTDGGSETRNARRDTPDEFWDCTLPHVTRTHPDYLDTLAMFHAAYGSFDSFQFHDPVDCENVWVRFEDDTFTIQGIGNNLFNVTFTLKKDPA
jgi:hypothetical protein